MQISSKLIAEAVGAFSRLPGIGKKTALRLVLHLMQQPEQQTVQFAADLLKMRTEIKLCKNLKDEHNKCEQARDSFEKERKTIQNEIRFYKEKNKELVQKLKEEEEKQNKMHNYLANLNSQKSENQIL
jgi:Holliday junction resolvasome RuvABC DNA-binding subunit